MEQIILLNSDYNFLNYIKKRRALKLISKNKVEVLKDTSKVIWRNKKEVIKFPLVLRLIKLVRTVYRNRVPFNKRNVFIRDRYICQYCGKKVTRKITWDHVIPKGQGGKNSWENCVAACNSCNNKKGNRTPRQARMALKRPPFAPTIMEFIRIRMETLNVVETLVELGIY